MTVDYALLFDDVRTSTSRVTVAQDFSEEQRRVLALPSNASLVLRAGAGSGKTRVLVERAASLVESGVDPSRIAVVSFTRKSAEELTHRLRARLKNKRRLPVSTTLHALALRFAMQRKEVDLRPELAAEVLPQLRAELGSASDLSDKDLLTILGRYRESLRTDGTFGLAVMRLCELLVESGSDDFTSVLDVAMPSPEQRFTHLLVDEAQDLSPLQRQFIQRLMAPNATVWFVGDDDQAIFAFRGAEGTLLQQLASTAEHSLALSVNWRCPTQVVRAANRLMACSRGREALEWKAGQSKHGHVGWIPCLNVDEEVARAGEARLAGRMDVVLGRTNKGLEPFVRAGLPVATVHEAKGLEWPCVWVQGASAGRFPLLQADIEEERRLFYVALTRAKEELNVSWTGTPSVFVAQSAGRSS